MDKHPLPCRLSKLFEFTFQSINDTSKPSPKRSPTVTFTGIVITNLPNFIIDSDSALFDLEAASFLGLSNHIEVIGSDVRISFSRPIIFDEVEQIQKRMKDFLLSIPEIGRDVVSKIHISPHSEKTWEGAIIGVSSEQLVA